jgi:hypothetical protein
VFGCYFNHKIDRSSSMETLEAVAVEVAVKRRLSKEDIPDWVYEAIGDANAKVGEEATYEGESIFKEGGLFYEYSVHYRRQPQLNSKLIGFWLNRCIGSGDMGWSMAKKTPMVDAGWTYINISVHDHWFILIDYDIDCNLVTITTYGEPPKLKLVGKTYRVF